MSRVLGAIKRAVDEDPHPGRFVITGSVRADLDDETWAGTGRVIRIPVWPLTQREISRRAVGPGLLDRILESGLDAAVSPTDPPDLLGYLELTQAGGLPSAALSANQAYRRRWHASYLEQLVTRDAETINRGRDPVRLRRYLDVLAENTAGLPSDAALLDAGALNARTAGAYDRLLQALGILDVVPAWSTNRLKRLTERGKRYLTDTGLTAAALGVDARDMFRDGPRFGRLLDAFVTSQIRAEIATSAAMPRLHHLRDRDGHEIDLLLDYGRRGQIAIEIKACSAPTRSDASDLSGCGNVSRPSTPASSCTRAGAATDSRTTSPRSPSPPSGHDPGTTSSLSGQRARYFSKRSSAGSMSRLWRASGSRARSGPAPFSTQRSASGPLKARASSRSSANCRCSSSNP